MQCISPENNKNSALVSFLSQLLKYYRCKMAFITCRNRLGHHCRPLYELQHFLWHWNIPAAIISLLAQQPTVWWWAGTTLIKNLTVWEEVSSADSQSSMYPLYLSKTTECGSISSWNSYVIPFSLGSHVEAWNQVEGWRSHALLFHLYAA